MKYFLRCSYINYMSMVYYKIVKNTRYIKFLLYKLCAYFYSIFICNSLYRFERIQFSDNDINYDHFVFILLWIFNKRKDVIIYRY